MAVLGCRSLVLVIIIIIIVFIPHCQPGAHTSQPASLHVTPSRSLSLQTVPREVRTMDTAYHTPTIQKPAAGGVVRRIARLIRCGKVLVSFPDHFLPPPQMKTEKRSRNETRKVHTGDLPPLLIIVIDVSRD